MEDSPISTAPEPTLRPKLATWLFDRDLALRAGADLLSISRETLRRICLPFADPDRRLPSEEVLERVFEVTAGAITPEDFYPEYLRRAPRELETLP